MAPAIRVNGLGKKYRLGVTHARSLNEVASRWTRRLRGKPSVDGPVGGSRAASAGASSAVASREEFWALRDVSFEVPSGEVVGIIGRNGAGKSTLLKILSRVTRPSVGSAEIRGRVGSLLEVGTGFHPELTGRENTYMNGTLLGMTRREVDRQFDAIMDFAGIDRFVDTPVKRYSSGMKVRLGFAVAAHLEPEILIVDEVLAVGDAEFQRKCLGKMQDVAAGGRTILFVSHNLAAVQHLCTRGVVLSRGGVICESTAGEAVAFYVASTESAAQRPVGETPKPTREKPIVVSAVETRDNDGTLLDHVCSGQDFRIDLVYEAHPSVAGRNIIPSIGATTLMGQPVFNHHSRMTGRVIRNIPSAGRLSLAIRRLPLVPDQYSLSYSVQVDGQPVESVEGACRLNVIAGKFYDSGEVPPASHAVCLVDGDWLVAEASS